MAHLPPIIASQPTLKATFSAKWPPQTRAGGGQVEPVLAFTLLSERQLITISVEFIIHNCQENFYQAGIKVLARLIPEISKYLRFWEFISIGAIVTKCIPNIHNRKHTCFLKESPLPSTGVDSQCHPIFHDGRKEYSLQGAGKELGGEDRMQNLDGAACYSPHSVSVSGPGFRSISSGTPNLPISCNNTP